MYQSAILGGGTLAHFVFRGGHSYNGRERLHKMRCVVKARFICYLAYNGQWTTVKECFSNEGIVALRKNDAKGNYLSVDLTMYKAQLIKIRIDTPASGHKGSYVLTENYTAPDCVNAGSSKQALLNKGRNSLWIPALILFFYRRFTCAFVARHPPIFILN